MGDHDDALIAELPIDIADSHISYLRNFLQKGFAALEKLDKLDKALLGEAGTEDQSEDTCKTEPVSLQLLGLGPEKAGPLLATSCAETSLLSAVYWVVCAHRLLGEALPSELIPRCLELVWACHHKESGGFAPHPRQEPHLLATLSAIQLLLLMDRGDLLRTGIAGCETDSLPSKVSQYVLSLRLEGGTWRGRQSEASEGDSRFVYAALCALALLQNTSEVEVAVEGASLDQVTQWLIGCQNLDGGFGCRPDGDCESHAGHAFCCLGGLALVGGLRSLNALNHKRLIRWLCDRQCPEGGLNGRPGKAPDACYTWWTLSSAELLLSSTAGAMTLQDLFQLQSLQEFVFSCFGASGGCAAHPGDDPDPFHTLFGLAGLSLLSWADGSQKLPWLGRISPVVALPVALVPSKILQAVHDCRACVHL